jgi:CubicO group peptidase (beta-lactamase class C family)
MNLKEILELDIKTVQGKCDITPVEAHYDPERLEYLNKYMCSLIKEGRTRSGSYCLSRHGKIFADTAMGTIAAEMNGSDAFTPDTLFELQSVGKLITALAVLKLAEDGVLFLSQPVKDWIPEFDEEGFREIKIINLLTHTSGLCAPEGFYSRDERDWMQYLDESDPEHSWISAIVKTGLIARPGEKWIYSIVGYLILGELIKRAAGKEAEDFIKETILIPCEMYDTHWRKDARPDQLLRYNIANQTDLALFEKTKTEGITALAATTYPSWDHVPDTAGGEMSTAHEMMKLGEMILGDGYFRGKRVLGKKALSLLWTDLTSGVYDVTFGKCAPIMYGAGVPIYSARTDLDQILSAGTIYHEGAGSCVFLVDRDEDFVAMFQTSFIKEFDWDMRAVKGVASIIWSGIR